MSFKVQRLGSIAVIDMGQSPPAAVTRRDGVGIPLLNGPTEFTSRHPLPVQWTSRAPRTACEGDVLFCVRGSTTGRMNIADQKYAIGRGLAAVRGKDESDTNFVFYSLQHKLPQLLAQATGSTFPNLSSRTIGDLAINMPPPVERQAIAEVLGALDGKITDNENLAKAAEALAVMTASMATGRLLLSDIATLSKRQTQPSILGETLVHHFSLPAFDSDKMPALESASTIKSGKFVIDQPSVLVSKLNPRFPRIWHVDSTDDAKPALASTEFLVMQPHKATTAVLWAILADPSFSRSLESKVAGTSGSHQRVRPVDVLIESVIDPSALTSDQTSLIEASVQRAGIARRESLVLAALRDTLLPELMSGRLRVKDAERTVEEVL